MSKVAQNEAKADLSNGLDAAPWSSRCPVSVALAGSRTGHFWRACRMTAFTLRNVTLGYDGHPAIHHLDGRIDRGSLTAIVGPNGSGKSTLLKGLVGFLKPLDGLIERNGFHLADIAYLPQAAAIESAFPPSVIDLVGLGLWRKRSLFKAFVKTDRDLIHHALETVGLHGFEDRPINTLSGGQLQRALFARVMLQDSTVILLDEPFTAIDAKTVEDLLELVRRWHGEKRTVVAVLHDYEMVRNYFPQSVLLAREAVAWGPTAETLKPANLLKARTMYEAWDEHAPWCAKDVA
jgi:zinc/manganese transport system ATP-binding protein